jgi:hypothetical protein
MISLRHSGRAPAAHGLRVTPISPAAARGASEPRGAFVAHPATQGFR